MKLNAKQADECEHHDSIWDWMGPTVFIDRIKLVLYLMSALILYSEALLAKVPWFLCH